MSNNLLLVITFISCLLMISLFLKFVIVRWYKKYMIKTTNTSAAMYSLFLTTGITILLYTFLEPLKDIIYITDKNSTEGYAFVKAFTPLIGQCLLLIFLAYLSITLLSKTLFKLFFNAEGIMGSVLKESIVELLLFGMIYLSFTLLGSVFIERLFINFIPLSNSIT